MRHTVTRLLPEAYSRLAAIKDKYPALTPFDAIKDVAEGSKAIRITVEQLELLKAQAKVTGCTMIQILSDKVCKLADKLGV